MCGQDAPGRSVWTLPMGWEPAQQPSREKETANAKHYEVQFAHRLGNRRSRARLQSRSQLSATTTSRIGDSPN